MIRRKPSLISIASEETISFLMLMPDGSSKKLASLPLEAFLDEGAETGDLPEAVLQSVGEPPRRVGGLRQQPREIGALHVLAIDETVHDVRRVVAGDRLELDQLLGVVALLGHHALAGGRDGVERIVRINCLRTAFGLADVVGTYQCEWKTTLEDPERLKRFRPFVNAPGGDDQIVFVRERGQRRPATSEEKAQLPGSLAEEAS